MSRDIKFDKKRAWDKYTSTNCKSLSLSKLWENLYWMWNWMSIAERIKESFVESTGMHDMKTHWSKNMIQ